MVANMENTSPPTVFPTRQAAAIEGRSRRGAARDETLMPGDIVSTNRGLFRFGETMRIESEGQKILCESAEKDGIKLGPRWPDAGD
jgi:hypothetical protein